MGGITGDMDVFVIYDLGTDWLGVYPVGSKKAAEAKVALVHFAGAERIKSVYSDCSHEIAKAVKCLSKAPIPHLTSAPGMHATNGTAEN